jgi:hypothetical protein
MLTIFSTPKPFRGHSGIIQRNALKSWTLLHPDIEVILFGNEEGAAEVCRELGIRHEPEVRRNENGTKYLHAMFERARAISCHKVLCYANCDIMLTPEFCEAVEVTSKAHDEFLMIGRRWDTDITEPWDFQQSGWDRELKSLALRKGRRSGPSWVDYFCFSRDLYHGKMPAFLIGRHGWDPWLTWFARNSGVPLIDASRAVVAVHQNHDYAYLQQGAGASVSHAEASYNWNLGGTAAWHYYRTDAATEILERGRLRAHRLAWFGPLKTRLIAYGSRTWFFCLRVTRPIRHWLTARKKVLEPSS